MAMGMTMMTCGWMRKKKVTNHRGITPEMKD